MSVWLGPFRAVYKEERGPVICSWPTHCISGMLEIWLGHLRLLNSWSRAGRRFLNINITVFFVFSLSLPVRQVINETSWTPWRQNTDRWKQLHNKEFSVSLDCSKENPKFTFQASTFSSFSSFWGLGSKTAQTSEVLALLLVNKPALKPFL